MNHGFDPLAGLDIYCQRLYFNKAHGISMIAKRELTAHEKAINLMLFADNPDGNNKRIVVINFPAEQAGYGVLQLQESTGQLLLIYHVDVYGPKDIVREVFANGTWASTNEQPERYGILEHYTWQFIETVDWNAPRYQWLRNNPHELEMAQSRYERTGSARVSL